MFHDNCDPRLTAVRDQLCLRCHCQLFFSSLRFSPTQTRQACRNPFERSRNPRLALCIWPFLFSSVTRGVVRGSTLLQHGHHVHHNPRLVHSGLLFGIGCRKLIFNIQISLSMPRFAMPPKASAPCWATTLSRCSIAPAGTTSIPRNSHSRAAFTAGECGWIKPPC